ncbi:M20/M25/M40 family metallo-hydrolase [Streptacidiphilus jiangxiensis]|uniref:Acetylornithine deacetylase/Succinyl-diaminopimelate desuccinylase n=1 Tax=Streptacidiphilus jiangxiensis TaxID=235985 RepID=A0A1H7VP96_STRJI|nr:M20/M25/M40 family metallo-hydrolase [Streptacidiphilus jiangxiensis]SEM11000.1 Acetylornithine deacetylase/Succinyl-diaminopimelate desuccinylase [Streptacidiphilus jiangxiensis]
MEHDSLIARLGLDWAKVESEVVEHLSRLVRLDTSNPPGNEIAVAEYLTAELAGVGVPAQVLQAEPGRANLVARLSGSDRQPPLMLLGHADVVGANPQHWKRPPFSGEIADGCVWGRGALDMKSQIAAGLVIVKLLRSLGLTLTRDILYVVTADEEAGSHLGAHWLWENHRSLVEADIAFNEGGGQRFETPTGPLFTVQVAEKGSARLRLTAAGSRGHASIPRTDNAIFHLASGLVRLQSFQPDTLVSPAARRLLGMLAEAYPDAAPAIANLVEEPTWAKVTGLDIDPTLREYVLAGTHNTAVPTLLSAGERINVTPVEASVELDCRLLPGEEPERWARVIQGVVGDRVEVTVVRGRASAPVRDDAQTLDILGAAIAAAEPGARILPYINSASSDARALPGVKVFGFFPSASDVDYMRLIHGTDEHARISDLSFGTRCLFEAVLRAAT